MIPIFVATVDALDDAAKIPVLSALGLSSSPPDFFMAAIEMSVVRPTESIPAQV